MSDKSSGVVHSAFIDWNSFYPISAEAVTIPFSCPKSSFAIRGYESNWRKAAVANSTRCPRGRRDVVRSRDIQQIGFSVSNPACVAHD